MRKPFSSSVRAICFTLRAGVALSLGFDARAALHVTLAVLRRLPLAAACARPKTGSNI
jgi:hypothetical protein